MIFTKIKQIFAERKEAKEKMLVEIAETKEKMLQSASLRNKREDLQNNITNLINIHDYSTVQTLIENGYPLNDEQNNLIHKILDDIKSPELKSLINSNYVFTHKNLSYLFTHTNFKLEMEKNKNFNIELPHYTKIQKLFISRLSDNNFLKQLTNDMKKELSFEINEKTHIKQNFIYSLKDKVHSLNYVFLETKDLLKPFFNVNDKTKIITCLEKNNSLINNSCYSNCQLRDDNYTIYKQEIIEHLNNLVFNNSNKETLELVKATKEVFLGENVEKNISKLSENQILAFSIKKLPDNIQSLIVKIESNCQKLNGIKDIEIQHVVDQTIDKLLPETLKKYSMMDDEYKTTMKNKDGKSAQDLLIESLNNMNDKLINIIHNKNENHLMEMEIGASFTKKLKNA